jgi:Mn2+/Fe2+ NRAMP family transporter
VGTVFATMRRKRRSATMKQELSESVDHFKRAATLAAQETGATVGPKLYAARDRVQPTAVKAKDAASTSWESAVAALTPLIVAATENVRLAGRKQAEVSKKQAKANRKNAKRLEKRTSKALGRTRTGRGPGRLFGLALAGTAVGACAAYAMRRRKAAQWDEYDPSRPISSAQQAGGADDAAFEPASSDSTNTMTSDTTDQTSSPQHSPTVARMAGGGNKEAEKE